eukprot:945329-Rhodomonas_salina.1
MMLFYATRCPVLRKDTVVLRMGHAGTDTGHAGTERGTEMGYAVQKCGAGFGMLVLNRRMVSDIATITADGYMEVVDRTK